MKFVVALCCLPFCASADVQPEVQELMRYMDDTAACFDEARTAAQAGICVGQGATQCMETERAGYSTLGMMFCTLAENEAWDVLLNRVYGNTMAGLRAMDAQEGEIFPEYANRADSLRTAQRAWIPFRDAQCALEYDMWGAGSMRQIASASCQLEMTAKRTIYLRFLLESMQGD